MLPNQNQVLRCVCFRSYIVIISIARPAKSFQNFSLSDIYSFFSTHQHHPSRTQKSPWSTSIREFLLLLIFFFFHSKINPVGITLTHPTFIFTEPYNLKLSSHSKLPSTTTTPHKILTTYSQPSQCQSTGKPPTPSSVSSPPWSQPKT